MLPFICKCLSCYAVSARWACFIYHDWYVAGNLILLTLKSSIWELGVLCALFLSGTLIYSTAIYYAEYPNPHSYPNIPSGFWWAIVTMTTVGYGDMYPTTLFGYTIGAVCAVMGIFAASMLIPIISVNFIQMRNDWLQVYGNDLTRRQKTYEQTIETITYIWDTEQAMRIWTPWSLFCEHGLTFIIAWISNHIPSKGWIEISFQLHRWERISNFIQKCTGPMICWSILGLEMIRVDKGCPISTIHLTRYSAVSICLDNFPLWFTYRFTH